MKKAHLIPIGSNCFTPIHTPCKEGSQVYKIKHCPFWSLKSSDGIKGHCEIIRDSTDSEKTLLFEQMKICGKNL